MTVDNGWDHPAAAVRVADPSVSYFTSGSFTMSSLSRLLCVVVVLFSTRAAFAVPIGPFEDGRAYLPPGPVAKWIQTRWKADVGGTIYTGTDLIHIKKDGTIDV